jgi:hypothetical protein
MTKLQQFFGENISKQWVSNNKKSPARRTSPSLATTTTTTNANTISLVTQRVLRAKSKFPLLAKKKKRNSRRASRVLDATPTVKKKRNSRALDVTPSPAVKRNRRVSRVPDTRVPSLARKQTRRRMNSRRNLTKPKTETVYVTKEQDVVSDSGIPKAIAIPVNHQQTIPFIFRTYRPVSRRSDTTDEDELWSTKGRSRVIPVLPPPRSYSPSDKVWAREKGGHRVVERNLDNVIHALRAL